MQWQRTAVFVAGVVGVVLGVALRWFAIWTLGRYFTRDVAVVGRPAGGAARPLSADPPSSLQRHSFDHAGRGAGGDQLGQPGGSAGMRLRGSHVSGAGWRRRRWCAPSASRTPSTCGIPGASSPGCFRRTNWNFKFRASRTTSDGCLAAVAGGAPSRRALWGSAFARCKRLRLAWTARHPAGAAGLSVSVDPSGSLLESHRARSRALSRPRRWIGRSRPPNRPASRSSCAWAR